MTNKQYIYWKEEEQSRKWKLIQDTPKEREQALRGGAMFLTWCSLSEPYEENGQPEPRRWGDFPLDFDEKENPDKALQDIRTLCLIQLPALYNIDPYAIQFFVSGSKGFHALIPAKLFGAQDGDMYLPLIYKKIAAEWKERFSLSTLDLSLYNMRKGKLFRIPNVKRKNGRYKVPLSLEEIRDLSIKGLWVLAKAPREIEPVDADIVEQEDLSKEYTTFKEQVRQDMEERCESPALDTEVIKKLSKELPTCIQYILSSMLTKSETVNFNRLTMVLITYFQMRRGSKEEAIEKAQHFIEEYTHSETYDTPRKRLAHWNTQWNYLNNNEQYQFHCKYVRVLNLPAEFYDCRKCPGNQYSSSLPRINTSNKNLCSISEKTWDAVVKANSPPALFTHPTGIVRLENDQEKGLIPRTLRGDHLRYELARRANFYKRKEEAAIADLPPMWLVKDMLAEPTPPLPYLSRIVTYPIFTQGKTLHSRPGYLKTSQCFYQQIESLIIPDVPQKPTVKELEKAREFVLEILCDFPFVSKA